MIALMAALRAKYGTPHAAMWALGLDEGLLKQEKRKMAATTKSKPIILTRKAAMTLGAVAAFLQPRMAADACLDLEPILARVTDKNFATQKPIIAAAITKGVKGKLAQDASIDGLTKLLDGLEGEKLAERGTADALETDPNSGVPMPVKPPAKPLPIKLKDDDKTMDDDPVAKVKAFLEGKISPEDLAKIEEIMGAGEEEEEVREAEGIDAEPPPFKGEPKVGGKEDKKDMITKPAMDKAITAAVAAEGQRQKDIRDAERFVRPWVNEVAPQETAAGVYKAAAAVLGIDGIDDLPAAAIRKIIELTPKPGTRTAVERAPTLAADAAAAASYAAMFPGAQRIGTV